MGRSNRLWYFTLVARLDGLLSPVGAEARWIQTENFQKPEIFRSLPFRLADWLTTLVNFPLPALGRVCVSCSILTEPYPTRLERERVMAGDLITWDHAEKSRTVEMVVDYQAEAGDRCISAIRPVSVTFYNAETKAAERTVGVHTETGQRLLRRQYLASGQGQAMVQAAVCKQSDLHAEQAIATAV